MGCIKGLYFNDNKIITILSEGIVASHDEAFIPEYFGADHEIVQLALEAQNIEAWPMWPPARRTYASERSRGTCDLCFRLRSRAQSARQKYKARVVGGEIAEDLFNRGLCLPAGTVMKEKDSKVRKRTKS